MYDRARQKPGSRGLQAVRVCQSCVVRRSRKDMTCIYICKINRSGSRVAASISTRSSRKLRKARLLCCRITRSFKNQCGKSLHIARGSHGYGLRFTAPLVCIQHRSSWALQGRCRKAYQVGSIRLTPRYRAFSIQVDRGCRFLKSGEVEG